MIRLPITPRADWPQRVEEAGLTFHTPEGQPYWDESYCYQFESREVDELESATEELQRLCLVAAQTVIDQDRVEEFGIPLGARQAIRNSWSQQPPSLYGRFDLAYDGTSPPKLLEYNANTPTSLLEASVVQWYWLRDVFPSADQFNSLHEKLIAQWKQLRAHFSPGPIHFTAMPSEEDLITLAYLRDTAEQAGFTTCELTIRDIGWNQNATEFRDLDDQPIRSLFSLYPWEWLLQDFERPILDSLSTMRWIEPIWKMLWSNKALLVVLWELFPDHPNLLPAYLDGPRDLTAWVRKPLLGREGANIALHLQGADLTTPGNYGTSRVVYQQFAGTDRFDGQSPVLGSWYITGQGPAGMGIREAPRITTNSSRFIPHLFR